MAKRKRRSRKQPLNWAAIISSAIIVSAFIISYLAFGDQLRSYFPAWREVENTFSEIWQTLLQTDRPSKPAGSSGELSGETAEVHFIDVGQGDCMLIRCDGADILIDAGENNQGETVNAYLDKIGVDDLDLVIGTHAHSDHIGGLDVVLSSHQADAVILPPMKDSVVPTTRTYEDLLYAIGGQGLEITTAVPGDIYTFGDGTLEILGPVKEYDDLNNTSVVCRFEYGEISFLFTGDMEADAESDLLQSGANVEADFLKLGHHGSSTSTSEDFLRAVNPSVCLIEVGEGNSYNHPHAETIALVEGYGCEIYRTDLNGSIVVQTDGKNWNIATEK